LKSIRFYAITVFYASFVVFVCYHRFPGWYQDGHFQCITLISQLSTVLCSRVILLLLLLVKRALVTAGVRGMIHMSLS